MRPKTPVWLFHGSMPADNIIGETLSLNGTTVHLGTHGAAGIGLNRHRPISSRVCAHRQEEMTNHSSLNMP